MPLDNPSIPSGCVMMYGGATAPLGWLLLDGSAISRTTYATLFAIFSTTYGTGDGSTTFNLPDTRGVFIRGAGSQTISSISYTGTRGTTQGDQLQGHYHNLVSDAGYNLASGAIQAQPRQPTGSPINYTNMVTAAISDGTNGTPRVGTETRPANISMTYIVKI